MGEVAKLGESGCSGHDVEEEKWTENYEEVSIWCSLLLTFPASQHIVADVQLLKSCLTLCELMYYSTQGSPVLHYLLEFAQTYVHWVSGAIQPILSSVILFFPCPQSFPESGSFPMSWLFASDDQSIGTSAEASVLPMNIQGWFPLGLTGLISLLSNRLSRVFSSTSTWKHQLFVIQKVIYDPTLTSIHDYWKDQSFDYMDLCQQSDVPTF